MTYGVNKYTLCTIGEKEEKLLCYPLLSFSPPNSAQHPACCWFTVGNLPIIKRKKVCLSLEPVCIFGHVSPDKAILVLVGQCAPELYPWAFPCVPQNPLKMSLQLCCPEKYRMKKEDQLLRYCIAGLLYIQNILLT